MRSARSELRAIFSGVEVGPDAEVALRDSVDLDRERLRLPALQLGRPFRCDLRADNQDRYAEQQRVLEPPRLELEADELSHSDVEQFVEAKARSTPSASSAAVLPRILPGRKLRTALTSSLSSSSSFGENGRHGRSVAHRSTPLTGVTLADALNFWK